MDKNLKQLNTDKGKALFEVGCSVKAHHTVIFFSKL